MKHPEDPRLIPPEVHDRSDQETLKLYVEANPSKYYFVKAQTRDNGSRFFLTEYTPDPHVTEKNTLKLVGSPRSFDMLVDDIQSLEAKKAYCESMLRRLSFCEEFLERAGKRNFIDFYGAIQPVMDKHSIPDTATGDLMMALYDQNEAGYSSGRSWEE